MEKPALSVIGKDRCDYLRWKGLFIDAHYDPTAQQGERLYWCHHTYNCLGPDGKAVDEYECSPARNCYKAL